MIDAPTLGEFIPKLSPTLRNPRHLAPFLDVLERAPHGNLRVVFSAPPRHEKTETVSHAVARWLVRDPALPIFYLTYAERLALSKSRHMRSLALRAGVRLGKDTRGKSEWLTPKEGGMRAAGIDGTITGHGCNVLLLDDLHKDRAEAESQAMRDHAWSQAIGAVNTRLEPDGSAILYMQRWNDDDCAARAIALGWDHINLPAIDGDPPRALCPDRYSLEVLLRIKASSTDYDWASQYEGNPKPRSGRLFGDPILVDAAVPGRSAEGVDLAHSAKTRSDFQAAIAMVLDLREDPRGIFYITEIKNRRAKLVINRSEYATAEEYAAAKREGFVDELRDFKQRHRGPMGMYVARQENALLDVISSMPDGVHIEQYPADSDKWLRAQPFSIAWAQGRVRLVRGIENLDAFVSQAASFTGKGDGHDDMIDAACCAHDMLCESAGLSIVTLTSGGKAGDPEGPRRSSSGRRLFS